MQDTNTSNVTDVEFKEVPTETTAPAATPFDPVTYLSTALLQAGHPNPTAWTQDIDQRAVTAEEEKDRIFFANRALRLFMAEQEVPDTITARMLVADGIDAAKWAAIVDQGIVPWMMGQFDEKGQRKTEEAPAEATLQDGVESAPVSDTKVDAEEVREGSMDSLPGSIEE